ncbi:hypothetical protein [Streptomyces sp. NPDC004286]|uniref:hypothetical protein n=1 Tax=Streptomyces sp. NPDC004286 TaxID=3364696 RepID=UPI0036819D16
MRLDFVVLQEHEDAVEEFFQWAPDAFAVRLGGASGLQPGTREGEAWEGAVGELLEQIQVFRCGGVRGDVFGAGPGVVGGGREEWSHEFLASLEEEPVPH